MWPGELGGTIGREWSACPLSCLYDRHEPGLVGAVNSAADDWNRAVRVATSRRWFRAPIQARRVSSGDYLLLAATAPLEVLAATLEHIARLRRLRRVRASLVAVAFLEEVEGLVSFELERRTPVAWWQHLSTPGRPGV